MPLYDKAMRIQYYVKKSHPDFGKANVKDVYRPIKYYACGEYGKRFSRPHYHVCLFGYEFPDKEVLRQGTVRLWKNVFKQGIDHTLYTSKTLEKIWGKGFVTIGELTIDSAGYVARYVMKKIYGDMAAQHYQGRLPEFALMSKGLGKKWFEQYKSDCYPEGS